MNAETDLLLKEVDTDLQTDKQLEALKTYGPWVGGAAALLVTYVGVTQVTGRLAESARQEAAAAYQTALIEAPQDLAASADALLQVAEQVDGGYSGLAELRASALLAASGDMNAARQSLQRVYDNPDLPQRMRDLARVRAALSYLDDDPGRSVDLVAPIETESMRPFATEIDATAALLVGDYEAAYAGFSALAGRTDVPEGMARRADMLRSLADAGRNGITLDTPQSEAESFLEEFGADLLITPPSVPDDAEPTGDAP